MNGIHDNMRVNGLRVGVSRYDAFTAFKHFFGASLGVLLNHKGVGVIGTVGRQLEVIILSLTAFRTFTEPRRRLLELFCVVLVDKQVLHVDEPCFILAGYIGDYLVRFGFARNTFEQRHFNFPR